MTTLCIAAAAIGFLFGLLTSGRRRRPPCADCNGPVGLDRGPSDGWQCEDGRTICDACAAADLRRMSADLRRYLK